MMVFNLVQYYSFVLFYIIYLENNISDNEGTGYLV